MVWRAQSATNYYVCRANALEDNVVLYKVENGRRTDLPLKGTMKVLFLVPFMLPSFIGALAWKMLLSPRSGYINRFFIEVLGFDGPVFDIYTYGGIIAVETMYLFPFVFIQVSGALERMDPTLEESARISGADLFTITRRITLPLVLPSILSGALLLFSGATPAVPERLAWLRRVLPLPLLEISHFFGKRFPTRN